MSLSVVCVRTLATKNYIGSRSYAYCESKERSCAILILVLLTKVGTVVAHTPGRGGGGGGRDAAWIYVLAAEAPVAVTLLLLGYVYVRAPKQGVRMVRTRHRNRTNPASSTTRWSATGWLSRTRRTVHGAGTGWWSGTERLWKSINPESETACVPPCTTGVIRLCDENL